ncbi:MAG: GDSL-type esterase/lipase family protein [Gemmataceae bacterium]|nr:GDSL-type esterase/lipase family protein [Gemmata sp.]MDW8196946.1 GDSL-type esterase/lipase family protein [Gemmataceae bacterium]
MRRYRFVAVIAVGLLWPRVAQALEPVPVAPMPRVAHNFARWEKSIAAHEQRLRENPPKPQSVFFVGSSSIVRWDVEKAFPGKGYVNVGFGGSIIADSTHFAPRIITPYRPGTIIFYAGDNDIARGHSAEQVLNDFQKFVAVVRQDNPECRILFIAIKPSIARWKLYEVQKKANALVKDFCQNEKGLVFVDIVPRMLNAEGQPIAELFVKDGLHLSDQGYELWNAEIRKLLPQR